MDDLLQREVARGATLACFAVALLLTASTVLLVDAGAAFLGIVGVGVLCECAYSSPPIRLVSRGVGEVVAGVVGFLVPATG